MTSPVERMATGHGGLRLCVRQHAGGEGPPLLVLHGFLDQSASWDLCAPRLATRGPVFVPDQRGFGHSEHIGRGGTYHFSDYVLDLDALLRELSLGPFHLIGHSMGATVACYLAAALPEQVLSLTLVDGIGPPRVPDDKAPEQLRTHLHHHRRPRGQKAMQSVEDAAARLTRANPALPPDFALALAMRGTKPGPQGVIWRWDPQHRARSALPFDADRFSAHLAQVRCPAHLILGEQGWFQHLPDLEERLGHLRASSERIPGGHNLHLDNPEGLAQAILGFLPR